MPYDDKFAIRGLHYDTKCGFLLKLDAFRNIQLDTVHRGRTPVSAKEVIAEYGGTHINQQLIETDGARLVQLTDLFSMPTVCTPCVRSVYRDCCASCAFWVSISYSLGAFSGPCACAVPWRQACLLANVQQLFNDRSIHHYSRYLFDDVNQVSVHQMLCSLSPRPANGRRWPC